MATYKRLSEFGGGGMEFNFWNLFTDCLISQKFNIHFKAFSSQLPNICRTQIKMLLQWG